jgi:hypothetical protein
MEDIQNLRVENYLSDRFELQWEIPAGCQKVENVTIPVTINGSSILNIR